MDELSRRRTEDDLPLSVQRIRLIKKLAPVLNDIDLSSFQVGDVLLVAEPTAAMLIREGWAERATATTPWQRECSHHPEPAGPSPKCFSTERSDAMMTPRSWAPIIDRRKKPR
jgi:hypothetical protein